MQYAFVVYSNIQLNKLEFGFACNLFSKLTMVTAAEIFDVSASDAFNIIHEIHKEGQISDETANACKEKFYRVHELLMQNLQNEKKLVEEAKILREQLTQEMQKLEQAQNNQKNNEDTLKDLMTTLNEVKKEGEAVEERDAVLRVEIQTLMNDKNDLLNDLKTREERERERLIPEIDSMQRKIKEMKEK